MESLDIIIPAFNEEKTVYKAVEAAASYGNPIVVDDGSVDSTRFFAMSAGAMTITHPQNKGYSAAIRTGLEFATADIVCLFDADLQQDATEIPRLVNPIRNHGADMVIGSKFLGSIGYKTKRANRIVDRFVCNMIKRKYGVELTHSLSGLRAMRRDKILLSDLRGNHFENGLELDISFLRRGLRVMEVPRKALPRQFGKSNLKARDIAYGMNRMLRLMYG